jgi:hypothetical protein
MPVCELDYHDLKGLVEPSQYQERADANEELELETQRETSGDSCPPYGHVSKTCSPFVEQDMHGSVIQAQVPTGHHNTRLSVPSLGAIFRLDSG